MRADMSPIDGGPSPGPRQPQRKDSAKHVSAISEDSDVLEATTVRSALDDFGWQFRWQPGGLKRTAGSTVAGRMQPSIHVSRPTQPATASSKEHSPQRRGGRKQQKPQTGDGASSSPESTSAHDDSQHLRSHHPSEAPSQTPKLQQRQQQQQQRQPLDHHPTQQQQQLQTRARSHVWWRRRPPPSSANNAPLQAADLDPKPTATHESSQQESQPLQRRRQRHGSATASTARHAAHVLAAVSVAASRTACCTALGVGGRCLATVAAFLLCSFFPRTAVPLGVASILGTADGGLLGWRPPLPPAGQRWRRRLLWPAARLRGPLLSFGALRLAMPLLLPSVWRSLMYWQRLMPVVVRYYVAARRASALSRRGDEAGAAAVWEERHVRGAGEIFDILADLKGFYLKLGQILATKVDMLPPVYCESLGRLLDKLPPAPFSQVKMCIESELGGPLREHFRSVETFPLASATVAQVHGAVTVSGERVVVKVQHRGVHKMMAGDLRDLKLLSDLLIRFGVELGFDHGSAIREYCRYVPLEFDFEREAFMAAGMRRRLIGHARNDAVLQGVVIPPVFEGLSTRRLITLGRMEGVPILDIAGMDLAVRHAMMTSVVLAYGYCILKDGCFQTDPHPGNLLALAGPSGCRAAILDFGQVKELRPSERLRYAALVLAVASRDDGLLRSTLKHLGVTIHGCSDAFQAAAGYILFDTRMDIPEAFMSPMDPDAPEFRSTRLPALAQDLFMLMRVVTLLRGVLAALGVDVSSALLWRPLALDAIRDLTELRIDNGHVMGDEELVSLSLLAAEAEARPVLRGMHK